MTLPEPKSGMRNMPRYEPGRPLEEVARELGLDGIDDMVKLASNENALGPSPRAVEAMRAEAARMHLYPDGGAYYLREALASHLNVDPAHIMQGNGSNELIELLGHVYLSEGDNIVMSQCAFVVYALVAMLFRANTIVTPMRDFTHDLDAMLEAVTPATRLVFIANPNNPTGTRVSADALNRFIERAPDHVMTVIDEAYIELLDPADQPDVLRYVRDGRSVCVLRTFSKAYGLAGLRLGYAVGSPALMELLDRARQPFNVNTMAQVAAIAALDDQDHVEATRRMVRDGIEQIQQALDRSGIGYVPTCSNFILVNVGKGRDIFRALQQQHVIVRPMDGYGLPKYVRVTIGTTEENQRFLDALSDVLPDKD